MSTKIEHSTGTGVRFLLAWGVAAAASVLTVLALRVPAPATVAAPSAAFSAERVLVHVRAVASAPHPIGSLEYARVRQCLIGQLSALGFNPHVFRAWGPQQQGEHFNWPNL